MRFLFYSGYRDLKGGYTTLLLCLIKELYRQEQQVVLINFSNGLIAGELASAKINIEIIDLDTINWDVIHEKVLPTDVLVITRFEEVYNCLMSINPRVVYYDINDFICSISDYKFGIALPAWSRKLVRRLYASKSLCFMDDTGIFNLQNGLGLKITQPVFLPVPVEVPAVNAYLGRLDQCSLETLRLTYIGRSVDWKMIPLKKILDDINNAQLKIRMVFSIVVDDIDEMKKYINFKQYQGNSCLDVKLYENLRPSEINAFLLDNADLHFAMGTAALDAAKLGIPTVVMDYSVKEFPGDYRYQWLHGVSCFSLGKNLDKRKALPGYTIHEVISEATEPKRNAELSGLSYNYVAQKHSVHNIVGKLISVCDSARFRMKDAQNLVPFYSKFHASLKALRGIFSKSRASL